MEVVKEIYKLRRDFILIGLTGRTGSGCSSVANILRTQDFAQLKSEHRDINENPWDNNSRKNRIVYQYMKRHWYPFTVITASDVIFYYALLLDFDDFVKEFSIPSPDEPVKTGAHESSDVVEALQPLKTDYEALHQEVMSCDVYVKDSVVSNDKEKLQQCLDVILNKVPDFRNKVRNALKDTRIRVIPGVLLRWGNDIRMYDSVIPLENGGLSDIAPSCLAHKLNKFVKIIRARNDMEVTKDGSKMPTHIVIDALRNPYEVLYFRERYSGFYLMSINTTDTIRRRELHSKGFTDADIKRQDDKESGKKDFRQAYMEVDIDKCIELSDIHLTHDGTYYLDNRPLVNQIITYLALIRHPGLIPPSPVERVMQIAYTAKLNSGCLSRQVGAAVTNADFSVQSVGWNTVPQGQTPCSLRCLNDLCNREDKKAYSEYERGTNKFSDGAKSLFDEYNQKDYGKTLLGLPLSYCFKDIHTTVEPRQQYNQVHTRALHAEENAILQLSKYGTQGVVNGILFTTSSCCEMCGRKAYQLGIKEIYYIDSYPGITHSHVINCGTESPKMILFHGAIGRAYSNLYNPFLPLKDEIEALSGVDVKAYLEPVENNGKTSDKKEER